MFRRRGQLLNPPHRSCEWRREFLLARYPAAPRVQPVRTSPVSVPEALRVHPLAAPPVPVTSTWEKLPALAPALAQGRLPSSVPRFVRCPATVSPSKPAAKRRRAAPLLPCANAARKNARSTRLA